MSDPISQANRCHLNPPEKMPQEPQQRRFALSESHYDSSRNDAYINVSDITYADRHDYLMNTNAAYRTLHYISVIFGAHDERSPEQYRGGLKRIVER
jgi:hypothetical protein